MNTQQTGKEGERIVASHLKKQGFSILFFNYRKPYGEIDIIARKKDTLCFVEVKTRKKDYFDLSTVITPLKQKKIIMTAKHYLAENNITHKTIQFDVALVIGSKPKITYISNAFREC